MMRKKGVIVRLSADKKAFANFTRCGYEKAPVPFGTGAHGVWWRRRELNPRPETFFCWFYMRSRKIWVLPRTLPIGGPVRSQLSKFRTSGDSQRTT